MKDPNPVRTKILQYTITFAVCLVFCFIYVSVAGIFKSWKEVVNDMGWNINNEAAKAMFILSNGTFIIGVLTVAAGLLVFAANGGAFEMIVYGFKRFLSLFQRDPSKVKFKTYYDYHVYRSNAPNTPFLFLILVGLFYLLASMVFVIIYLRVN